MILRDDEVAARARVRALRDEIRILRRHPLAAAARELRADIERTERRSRRIAAAIARRKRRAGWLRPRSLTEVAVAVALVATAFTLALGLVYLALSLAYVI